MLPRTVKPLCYCLDLNFCEQIGGSDRFRGVVYIEYVLPIFHCQSNLGVALN